MPVILAVNKADDKRSKTGRLEFYQLGFDQAFERDYPWKRAGQS